MGAAIGATLVEQGHVVLWRSRGRSEQTARRAKAAGLTDAADFHDAEMIVSVCPPHAALDVARSLRGTAALVIDANAVSPATARCIGELFGDRWAYAAWTKGSAALLLAALGSAQANGVEDALRAEWSRSLPDLEGRWQSAAESAAAKGWRWVGEMNEIAATFAAAGLPSGFHEAAAEMFNRAVTARGH